MNKEDLEKAAENYSYAYHDGDIQHQVTFLAGAEHMQSEINRLLIDLMNAQDNYCQSVKKIDALTAEINALKAGPYDLGFVRGRLEGRREGYIQGFTDSGEGFNGEFPFGDKGKNPLDDNDFVRNLNIFLKSLEAKDE